VLKTQKALHQTQQSLDKQARGRAVSEWLANWRPVSNKRRLRCVPCLCTKTVRAYSTLDVTTALAATCSLLALALVGGSAIVCAVKLGGSSGPRAFRRVSIRLMPSGIRMHIHRTSKANGSHTGGSQSAGFDPVCGGTVELRLGPSSGGQHDGRYCDAYMHEGQTLKVPR
jgi:hypothetical protein